MPAKKRSMEGNISPLPPPPPPPSPYLRHWCEPYCNNTGKREREREGTLPIVNYVLWFVFYVQRHEIGLNLSLYYISEVNGVKTMSENDKKPVD